MTYMLRKSLDRWPFPGITEARKEAEKLGHPYPEWTEISEDAANQLLGAVPPIYFADGGFYVGEEADADRFGNPIHCAVVTRNGRYFANEILRGTTPRQIAIHALHVAISRDAKAEAIR